MERDEFYANIAATRDYIAHHGVKGQQWGKRQYQNEDGSLTPLGYDHYYGGRQGKKFKKYEKAESRKLEKSVKEAKKAGRQGNRWYEDATKRSNLAEKEVQNDKELMKNYHDINTSSKRARIIGTAIGATIATGLGMAAIAKAGASDYSDASELAGNFALNALAVGSIGGMAVGQMVANKKNKEKSKETYAKLDAIERKYDNMTYADVLKEHERVFGKD